MPLACTSAPVFISLYSFVDIPFAPCCVKASNITSDSALISWIPCNSNFYHVVAVNSVEVRTVRPSIYKHLITGLSANTLYRVSVRAKPGKLLCSDEKNPKKLEMLTTFVDFRTLPKSALPFVCHLGCIFSNPNFHCFV